MPDNAHRPSAPTPDRRRARRRPPAVQGRAAPARRGSSTTRRSSSSSSTTGSAKDWICVGRAEEAANRGEYFLATVAGESVMVVRGADGELRAFHNVCRHRGSTILEETLRQGRPDPVPVPRLDLRPRRPAPAGEAHRGPRSTSSPPRTRSSRSAARPGRGSSSSASTRRPRRSSRPSTTCRATSSGSISPPSAARSGSPTRSNANWKAVAENYSECYHCPGDPPPAQPPDAVRHGRATTSRTAVGGRLHGARRERRDDVDRRPHPRPAAAAGDRGRRPPADLLLPRLAEPPDEPPPGLPAGPPGRAGRARTRQSSTATGSSIPTRSRRPASTRPTRSTSGT